MKIRMPNGQEKEADDIDFSVVSEGWNEYTLSDGTRMKIKLVVHGVVRTEDHDPMTGDPVYAVKTQNVLHVMAPEELKKLPQGQKPPEKPEGRDPSFI